MPYTANPGYGFQRAAYNMLEGLLANQSLLEEKNVKIIVYSDIGKNLQKQKLSLSKNITLCSYKNLPPTTFLQGPQNFCRLLIKEENIKIIHSNDVMFTLPAAITQRTSLVQTIHGFPWRAKQYTSSGYYKIYCDLSIWSNKLALKFIKNLRYVCVSPHVVRGMNEYFGIPTGKMTVIPDPISNDFFHVRKNEKTGMILYPARIVSGKNHLILIQALADLKKKGFSEFTLVLAGGIGDLEYYEAIKSLVNRKNLNKEVIFLGRVTGKNLLELYSQASAVIVTSLHETFSLAVAEAMATETAVIASPVGIVPDVIEDGLNGFIIDPLNSQDIAEKIYLLLCDDKLRRKIGQKGKGVAIQWTPEKVSHNLIDYWLSIT
jgi:glycosyltransferase involved in cell wall biosynthesis